VSLECRLKIPLEENKKSGKSVSLKTDEKNRKQFFIHPLATFKGQHHGIPTAI
jgi:hypothetical protein